MAMSNVFLGASIGFCFLLLLFVFTILFRIKSGQKVCCFPCGKLRKKKSTVAGTGGNSNGEPKLLKSTTVNPEASDQPIVNV
ncbi:Oidioi.mRNA.OKI2018_I69.XSR.g15443.t1.cds [Oikopleura dioica]|uniref:Oidioi.mRNA.OKI2018_I69.XSR.g15443.t1.cds n=1 Tax=Oikopleura dioica TaxID=34765 RepID=A0ABN7SKA2_OIKDI|nr:Oidioi.mRNA.OKI2018_I69.XSR.g15443.t1.cds [Oikopleura dioica]